MHREERRQAPDRDGAFEWWVADKGEGIAASPNEQQARKRGPEWGAAVENRRSELIRRNGNQGEGESQ
jgi:hypothetical protein